MSKKSSTEEKQNSAKLGINFPSGAKILLDSLAMLKNASQAEILVYGLLLVLESSSNSQKDAINGMIKAAGFTLRDLKKGISHIDSLAGQGGAVEQDGALARTNRIAELQTKMTSAVDIGIDSLAS